MAYGGYEVGKTEFLSAAETIRRLPGVKADGLKGGVQFWDAQFDDSRLNIALMKTAEAGGALFAELCAPSSDSKEAAAAKSPL